MNFSQVTDWVIPQGNVVRVTDSLNRVIWEKNHDYSRDYFFVEDASGQTNTLSIYKDSASAPTITVYKSTDQTNWELMGTTDTTAITATVPANSKLYLKATANAWGDTNNNNKINCNRGFNVGGNIMSLLNGDNFYGTAFNTNDNIYALVYLFYSSRVVDASNLILPATTLVYSCYSNMFENCTSLTTAPVLPATTLADYCYFKMFRGCTSLTIAPSLPASTLAGGCYSTMFAGCTSLTTAPALPATTLVYGCYDGMFYDCTSLTTTPSLPATTLASSCYGGMFRGCTSLTIAPSLPATTLASSCYSSMFYGCTSLTTAPALPATALTINCYEWMFQNCTSLTTAPALPATTLANYCYKQMFLGCTSLTTAPALPATTLTQNCYQYMFQNCTALTTAPALPATTLATECYSNMFKGCTSLTTAPDLPATTLAQQCYINMFNSCTNLNSVTTYANDISATNCLSNWLYGVAASGVLNNEGTATYPVNSASGIPTGWTEHKTAPTAEYFYVEDTSGAANTLSITKSGSTAPTIEVFYSTDQTNWTSMGTTDTTAITATIPANSKLYLRCNTSRWGSGASKYNSINCSGNFNVGGNINSLLYGDLFNGDIEFPSSVGTYTFAKLFGSSTTLINANNLLLPATTLVNYCYNGMFSYVTSLTSAPALPATTLAQGCYYEMFYHCTSLTSAPALPATTLANSCYNSMFKECYNLTTVPTSLPATTLYNECYRGMFYSCRAITVSPILPATTLVYACYQEMFRQCWNITNITTYATDISASQCLNNWLNGASSTGDFYNLGGATYSSDTSGIPSGWTEHTSL